MPQNQATRRSTKAAPTRAEQAHSRAAWHPSKDCRSISDILTTRYMRQADAGLIRYEKYQLRYAILEERLRAFEPKALVALRPDHRDLVHLVDAQLAHVARSWSTLIDTLAEEGSLFAPGLDGYCSSKLDVYLLDSLDTLYELDTDCAHVFPDYDSLFGDEVAGCHCHLCNASTEAKMRLKMCAVEFHGDLDKHFFCRVFRDLAVEIESGPQA
ncbi:hypothetical protein EXIGLDRAFT_759676 [Exidia glandulosa HHB12029]|uniref:Uncharacterized protein n=1 Tax=Exidia glandulosa HHB12029 TaxID=1314781 RepID=A0A165PR04_EXIGL|nr:hypothetical protein EXIGLDRAFT_759676 [Exidia glandulosa HHB12029]